MKKRKKIKGCLRISFLLVILVNFYSLISYGAGIVVDNRDLEKHRSIIKKTDNNIDLVEIVRANERGVSHNKFLEFNVSKEGIIFNNSSRSTLTTTGGLIGGNPNLEEGKEAKIILSEITGLTKSEVEGFIEIAGKEAEFILANPNGIYLSSGGFINTSKVTLITGRLVEELDRNGGMLFKISDAEIEIVRNGKINIENIDYFSVISKATKIGEALYSGKTKNNVSQKSQILIGSNSFDYTPGSVVENDYEYGIDAVELGAKRSGKVILIVTDKGVGVNTKSLDVARMEDLEINNEGSFLLEKNSFDEGRE